MKIINILSLLFVGLTRLAQAQGTETCDTLYSHRGVDLLKAASCYSALIPAAPNAVAQVKLYHQSMISLSALINDEPKSDNERNAIDQGLDLSNQLSEAFPDLADSFYWRGVFVSFNAIARDRGAMIPTHTFSSLRSIQQDLRRAMDLDPQIDFYGPNRVLGIMNTRMPAIVGGDKTLAETLLREAYLQRPVLSANHVAYAKILMVNGESDEAKTVIEHFLAMSFGELNPYPGQALLAPTEEVAKDRALAKAILAQLNQP